MDTRATILADTLVNYSLEINADDTLLIQAEDTFKEYAELIGNKAKEKGAQVIYELVNLAKKKALIERNDEDELAAECARVCAQAEQATARIHIDAASDAYYLKGVDPAKIANWTEKVRKPLIDRVVGDGKNFKAIKWNVVGFPSESYAQKAGMSYEEYCDFSYGATNIDWAATTDEMMRLKKVFDDAHEVRIFVPNKTDLTLSLKGRGARICNGKRNMPDGEFFFGPVENSANGHVYFPYESVRDGNAIPGIRLEFKDGEVISFSAEDNEAFLAAALALPGAKRIGELGIGMNFGIQKYTKNLLFDEKIGGTIHLAMGQSYKLPLTEGGGVNESPIHWDLVCDLRKNETNPGGELYVDGTLVQKDGKWLV